MKVTEVRISRVTNNESKVKAYATITLDNELVVTGLKIIEYSKDNEVKTMVSMPNSKGSDGKYYDDVFPLNKTLRNAINESVLNAYKVK